MLRQTLLVLYLTSSIFLLLAGILMGRLLTQIEYHHDSNASETYITGETDETTTNLESGAVLDSEVLALGKSLFRARCASCHNRNMRDDMTGPALQGITERWSEYPRTDLRDWIRNSADLVADGHPRAVALFKEWDGSRMPANLDLSEPEIDALLIYIERGR